MCCQMSSSFSRSGRSGFSMSRATANLGQGKHFLSAHVVWDASKYLHVTLFICVATVNASDCIASWVEQLSISQQRMRPFNWWHLKQLSPGLVQWVYVFYSSDNSFNSRCRCRGVDMFHLFFHLAFQYMDPRWEGSKKAKTKNVAGADELSIILQFLLCGLDIVCGLKS